jgi:3-isopropylmalate/(R)-2-methylmalate dehydratase small subunit
MRGRAVVFGDEINTDIITPTGGDYIGRDVVEILMDPVRPGFSEEVSDGDVIVAGEHFGSGSSRETAPTAIKEAGVAAVVAESFARIYYRNSVNIGLPALTCPDATEIVSEGDEVEVDLDGNTLRNVTTGETAELRSIDETVQSIYDAGGLLEYYHEHD